jgi:hypothetical protein
LTQLKKLSLSSSKIRKRDLELEDKALSLMKTAMRLRYTFPMTMRRNFSLSLRNSWISFVKTERPLATLLTKTQKLRKLKTLLIITMVVRLKLKIIKLVLRELLTKFLANRSNKSKNSLTLPLKLSESNKKLPLELN